MLPLRTKVLPDRLGKVLRGAGSGWFPEGFAVGRFPRWLHILVTQRTAPWR